MAIKYRFRPANATNPNAIIEDFDIQNLKNIRDLTPGGGLINAVGVTYFIDNDPEALNFETYEEAYSRMAQLQVDTFFVDEFVAPIDPQPEGLND